MLIYLINLSQKPQEEPITVMKIELCDPGAASPECRPVIGSSNVAIVKIKNDVHKPKIEFPVSQIDFVQSQATVNIHLARLGYRACEVACSWTTSRGHSGKIVIPEGEDEGMIAIAYDQEPQSQPMEVMEVTLEDPQSTLINQNWEPINVLSKLLMILVYYYELRIRARTRSTI